MLFVSSNVILDKLDKLSEKNKSEILDFINFLLSKTEKKQQTSKINKFLDLAGKVDIDEDAVNTLRETSKI